MVTFSNERYDTMIYNRCGRWSVKLPAVSLGAWQTYGGYDASIPASEDRLALLIYSHKLIEDKRGRESF